MKDHLRDYATSAFVFYAKVGGKEKYIEKLMDDLKKNEIKRRREKGMGSPSEAAIINAEKVIESRKAEFDDISAIEKTLQMLDYCHNGHDIKLAIEYVYFKDCWKDLEKGDIQDKVHYAEIQIPACERNIYRWLKKARETFAEERGLRI
jgi:hypothetical protein